jgi:hypothetical protein
VGQIEKDDEGAGHGNSGSRIVGELQQSFLLRVFLRLCRCMVGVSEGDGNLFLFLLYYVSGPGAGEQRVPPCSPPNLSQTSGEMHEAVRQADRIVCSADNPC